MWGWRMAEALQAEFKSALRSSAEEHVRGGRSSRSARETPVLLPTSAEATKAASLSQTADYIDRMIDAQDRRARSEEDFIMAAAEYQVSLVNLQRSKGKLLGFEGIQILRDRDDKNLPLLYLQKGGGEGKSPAGGKKLITTE